MIKLATLADYFSLHLLVMAHRIVHVVPFSPLYTHEDMFNCSTEFLTHVTFLWMILLNQALTMFVYWLAVALAIRGGKTVSSIIATKSNYIPHITMNCRHWLKVPKFSS